MRGLILMTTLICFTTSFSGQAPPSNHVSAAKVAMADSPVNSVTVFGSTSAGNANLYGASFDRRLSLFGVRYTRVLVRRRAINFNYTPEIIPLAILSQPAIGDFAVTTKSSFTHSQFAYAAGVNPVGAELVLAPQRKIAPFIGTTEGFLYFARNVPSAFAARFNFVIQLGAGVRVRLNENSRISIGYSFHHFSNDYQARENPGLDSHMVNFGYTFAFSKKSH